VSGPLPQKIKSVLRTGKEKMKRKKEKDGGGKEVMEKDLGALASAEGAMAMVT